MFSTFSSFITRPAPSTSIHVNRQSFGYWIAFAVLVVDHATKFWVHEFTPYAWSHVVTSYFNLVHVYNFGAAFSFLADAGGWQRFFFVAVALIASIWLIVILRKPLDHMERLAYALILGGALGNGLDRGVRGYVVDFLDFYWKNWHWPAFNIADISIVSGAVLLIFLSFRRQPAATA